MLYFDLDNTILNFDKSEEFALKKVFEFINIPYKEDYLNIYRPINEKWWRLFSEEKYKKEVIVVERFREFFQNVGIVWNDLEKIARVYLEGLSNSAFFIDGAEKFLSDMKSKGFRMAILTNGVEYVQQKRFKVAKLDRFFDFILTSERVGKPKPNPDIFFYAKKLSKVPLKESVYIGDNFETDFEGARNANLDFILFDFRDRYKDVQCDKVKDYVGLYMRLL
ncbi:haloacid dehalogenase [Thermosipho melanesiensis]|uniref:HAD-superfamily hydrolase, subfamily IA, variant 1 n=2 Tax=Thermosipho melanesiensis TaxID=46541 RepID=A6LLW3_THEM4|nr:YjjG family noncanonical pyrimidine nucleotidase [Thermosipho melanesiensis]ABR30914.1 HAD-superfamily hydrolase, subfamily IA, variant 1 [Thermosipho melanesiensis BI429]OOC35959.1 haloacid dehalogenase [Thermosipho melanesiensis]OOC38461.1 haloacid dehalogenase [Thermosipho melanesiensis]OOC38922.1 haloacid dehalogenase [Thermosipho melanesiensis]OOC41561.1 haloacid dehalogenase [Thermosipho melanesiensis]